MSREKVLWGLLRWFPWILKETNKNYNKAMFLHTLTQQPWLCWTLTTDMLWTTRVIGLFIQFNFKIIILLAAAKNPQSSFWVLSDLRAKKSFYLGSIWTQVLSFSIPTIDNLSRSHHLCLTKEHQFPILQRKIGVAQLRYSENKGFLLVKKSHMTF